MLSGVARQGKVSQQLGRKSKLLPCAASQGSGPRVSAAGATCLFRAAARNVPTEGQALAATIKLRHDPHTPLFDMRSPVRPHVRADHPAPCQTIREQSERTGVLFGDQSPLRVALW